MTPETRRFLSPLPVGPDLEWEGLGRLRGPKTPDPSKRPVLLTHGLSAAANTFEANERVPEAGAAATLAHALKMAGLDVWLLDWRGSCDPGVQALVDRRLQSGLSPASVLNFEAVLSEDLGPAIAAVGARYPTRNLSLMGHCMGGAALAMWLARPGAAKAARVDRVVLSTIGLFYQVANYRQVLSDEYLLAHFRKSFPGAWIPTVGVEPGTWGKLEDFFTAWKSFTAALLPLDRDPDGPKDFKRQSFLYGEPYDPRHLPRLHQTGTGGLFGNMSIDLLAQSIENVRRGVATRVDRPGVSYLQPDSHEGFDGLELTLVTGRANRLWHRSTVDRMYEWLLNTLPHRREHITKHVLEGFAHQDLYWGVDAPQRVYPLLVEALSD